MVTPAPNLWNNDVSQGFGTHEQFLCSVVLQRLLVVLQVVLDAVVDVRDLADLKLAALELEVLLQLGPAPNQQFPRLTVVQRQV